MSAILKAFLENEGAIRRFLAGYTKSAEDIEDFAQETFLRGFAAEMRHDIREPRAYLFQIARRVAFERFRKSKRAPMELLEDSGGSDILLDEDQATADEWLDGRRKLALFARAVAHLPPQCRKAFLLRRVDGLQYKQIANRMNITVSAVEKHVAAGMLKCHEFLRAHGYHRSEFGGVDKRRPKQEAADAVGRASYKPEASDD